MWPRHRDYRPPPTSRVSQALANEGSSLRGLRPNDPLHDSRHGTNPALTTPNPPGLLPNDHSPARALRTQRINPPLLDSEVTIEATCDLPRASPTALTTERKCPPALKKMRKAAERRDDRPPATTTILATKKAKPRPPPTATSDRLVYGHDDHDRERDDYDRYAPASSSPRFHLRAMSHIAFPSLEVLRLGPRYLRVPSLTLHASTLLSGV
ncbi:hypothetical protein FRC08_013740 [Ceratobasidium sp. 394]|nr:hypothetical protein FRC08_013740 [Ceratobasidium sp. 394]